MYRYWEALVCIFLLRLTTVKEDIIYQQEYDCPDKCQCEEARVNCTDLIPAALPRNIHGVVIFNPTEETLVPRVFCGVLWPNVKWLTVYSNTDDNLYLVDNLFNCLNRLETLKIQAEDNPVHLYRYSFAGLENVTLLDLTGCSRILSEKIYIALSEKSILPNLSRLILADFGNSWGSFKWTQNFTNALGYRNITEINLSSTTLSVQVDDFSPLCDSVTKLNISNDYIFHSHTPDAEPCNSLQTIDISGAHFPKSKQLPKHIRIANVAIDVSRVTELHVYDSVSTVFANSLLSRDHVISINNCSLTVPNNSSLTEVHLTKYNIPQFDLKLRANFIYLDLSSNSMETVGRHVFTNLNRIIKLDLSNNRLSKCNSFKETLSVLFQSNIELETLKLANNGLNYLPKESFTANKKLKYIDLSNNAFEKVTFDILHLSQLTLLDLRNNIINYLDNTTMKTLDHLYELKHLLNHDREKNQTLFVDLLDNPLKCHCDALEFVGWFVRTPVFATSRHLYHCEVDGRHFVMNEAAVAEAKEDCERPRRRLRIIILCSTIPTVCVITAVIVIYLVVTKRRKRLAYQQFEDTVQLIRDGDSGFQFPVFLSYSSEKHAFVVNHILEPLQVGENTFALFINTRSMKQAELTILSDLLFLLSRKIIIWKAQGVPQ